MSRGNGTQRSVLVVDDIEDNRVLLERSLRSGGYEVRCASSGAQAIAMMRERKPDIVLLDWMMPGLSGLETLNQIRGEYSAAFLPVIMCTAMGEEENVVQALEAGANDYVVKPISLPILRARMTAHLVQCDKVSLLDTERHKTKRRAAQQLRLLMEERNLG